MPQESAIEAVKADESTAAPRASFASLGLDTWLQKQCAALGLKHPTPVQQACIPAILKGTECWVMEGGLCGVFVDVRLDKCEIIFFCLSWWGVGLEQF